MDALSKKYIRSKINPTYCSYYHMKDRCYNTKDKVFPRYGGRGIFICDRWLGKEGFNNFLEDMGESPFKHQIERINNDGPYSPENCRWATVKEQSRNRRSTHKVTIYDKTMCLSDWAKLFELPHQRIYARRCKLNWSVSLALFVPLLGRGGDYSKATGKSIERLLGLYKYKY